MLQIKFNYNIFHDFLSNPKNHLELVFEEMIDVVR